MAVAVRRPPERSALLLVCFSLLIVGGFFSPYIAAHQRLSWSGTPRTAACGPPRLTLAANLSFVNAAFPSALETMYHAGVYRAADAAYHFAVRVVDTESSSRLAYFQLDEDFRMAGAGPEVLDTSASPGLQSHGATGPEDPRAVLDPLGNVIYTFHQPHGGGGRVHRPQFVYNLTTRTVAYINHSYARTASVEKNWVPFYFAGQLFFMTSVKPLRLIGPCVPSAPATIHCPDFFTEAESFATTYNDADQLLRGGTQLVEHSHGYFYGLAHTKYTPPRSSSNITTYRPALFVLSMLGTPKLIIHTHPLPIFSPGGSVFVEDAMSPVSIVRAFSNGSALVSVFTEYLFRFRATHIEPRRDVGMLARTECVSALVDTAVEALKVFAYTERELRLNSAHSANSKVEKAREPSSVVGTR